jgi:hypothetical protein
VSDRKFHKGFAVLVFVVYATWTVSMFRPIQRAALHLSIRVGIVIRQRKTKALSGLALPRQPAPAYDNSSYLRGVPT